MHLQIETQLRKHLSYCIWTKTAIHKKESRSVSTDFVLWSFGKQEIQKNWTLGKAENDEHEKGGGIGEGDTQQRSKWKRLYGHCLIMWVYYTLCICLWLIIKFWGNLDYLNVHSHQKHKGVEVLVIVRLWSSTEVPFKLMMLVSSSKQ